MKTEIAKLQTLRIGRKLTRYDSSMSIYNNAGVEKKSADSLAGECIKKCTIY